MTARDPRFSDWLVGSLRTGLLGIDGLGVLVAVSGEAVRILDGEGTRSCDELLGRPLREAFAHQPGLVALLTGALDGVERPGRAELRLAIAGESAAGSDEDAGPAIGYTLVPVRDDAGAVAGAALLFRDLTPFERADEQARLRDRLAALGEMAAGLAHEIRNPLASLEVLAGLLKRRLGERPEELGLVEELLAEIRTVAATVTASLDFVRPVELRREPVAPRALLEEAVERARREVAGEGAAAETAPAIEIDADPAQPAAWVDRGRVGAALVELVVNARRAMAAAAAPARGGAHRLRLAAQSDAAGGVVLDVTDSGPGVPEALRDRVFHPFFTTREEGTGLGLAEVQKVVSAHGGRVELATAPGGGARFRLHLPAARTGALP